MNSGKKFNCHFLINLKDIGKQGILEYLLNHTVKVIQKIQTIYNHNQLKTHKLFEKNHSQLFSHKLIHKFQLSTTFNKLTQTI